MKGRCTSVRLDYNPYVILILTYVDTVTRDPVQQDVLRAWRPCVESRKSIDMNSEDDSESDSDESTISEYTKKASSSRSAIMAKSKDEVEQDIISVSSGIWLTLYT